MFKSKDKLKQLKGRVKHTKRVGNDIDKIEKNLTISRKLHLEVVAVIEANVNTSNKSQFRNIETTK